MISVCIATYNGARFIKEQVESILPQLEESDEIIISDDNSDDETLQIAQSLNSHQIHIFHHEGEHGYTSNFENALRQAKGDYIFLADQDDIWHKNKVKICMKELGTHTLVASDAYLIDENGNIIEDSYYKKRHVYHTLWGNILKFGYLGCCLAFRKELLTRALPFPTNHKMCTHDNWLFLVSFLYYDVGIINDQLLYYRRHHNNVSSGGLKKTTTLMFKIEYRLYLIIQLLKRWKRPTP
jgi:cellulose synthase/poly-beta-1,6-N-acetylglucosamine synthase-like glycosyltransferase